MSEAKGSFKEALEVDPKCGDALVGDSVACLLGGKSAEAEKAFEYVFISPF